MTSPTTRTVDRRDAAITAGLAGAVLVVVGYASGIGLKPPQEVAATIPSRTEPPAAAPLSPAPAQPPAVDPPPVVSAPLPAPAAMPVPAPVATPSEPPMSMPSEPPSTAPAPAPTTAAGQECSPGLATGLGDGLPLVGGLTDFVTGLVSGLLGPVLDVLAPADDSGCTNAARTTAGGTP